MISEKLDEMSDIHFMNDRQFITDEILKLESLNKEMLEALKEDRSEFINIANEMEVVYIGKWASKRVKILNEIIEKAEAMK